MVDLLLSGGVGTTASLVSNTVVWLYQHPEVRQDLIDHPEKMDRAIEEFLRFFSPTQGAGPHGDEGRRVRGLPDEGGRPRAARLGVGEPRPELFENPDELDIERWPNRHTAFGIGVHRCAGSHLGRAMARELLGQIINRMGDYVVDLDALVPYPHQGTNNGWTSIPATFTPGPRLLAVDADAPATY